MIKYTGVDKHRGYRWVELADGLGVENGTIALAPVAQTSFSLEQLLEGVSHDNLHQEVDTGDAVGQET